MKEFNNKQERNEWIRKEYSKGSPLVEISNESGVSERQIRKICANIKRILKGPLVDLSRTSFEDIADAMGLTVEEAIDRLNGNVNHANIADSIEQLEHSGYKYFVYRAIKDKYDNSTPGEFLGKATNIEELVEKFNVSRGFAMSLDNYFKNGGEYKTYGDILICANFKETFDSEVVKQKTLEDRFNELVKLLMQLDLPDDIEKKLRQI